MWFPISKGKLKILGMVSEDGINKAALPVIAAHCNRVPVLHGHNACVSIGFSGRSPEIVEIAELWRSFRSEPQILQLPNAPLRPTIVTDEPDRPQPRLDRDHDKSMAVTVGRLRECPLLDMRFVGLHHNTVRGAAGGCLLIAELLMAIKYIY